ncbi:MAG: hypothetical protein U0Q12_18310 [Vicinamibacterales bacterium]
MCAAAWRATAAGVALTCVFGAGALAQTTTTRALPTRTSDAGRPTSDVVAKLNQALADGTRTIARDERTGYLSSVLEALKVSPESQLLVFSKTGVQRAYTGPRNPRALYFTSSVVVGYIPGAPSLEVAAHDPGQGVVFYTLDQSAAEPRFVRQTRCLGCHVTPGTLGVPGMIARSHAVDANGRILPALGIHTVNHRTPHTERWGGWFVTSTALTPPPYTQMGHLGNITTVVAPGSTSTIVSNAVLLDWLGSAPETHGYLSAASDIGSLLLFDHEMHAINLITRLHREARLAESGASAPASAEVLRGRVDELADYLLFVGEEPPAVPLSPRPGFAAHLRASVPADRRNRSLGQLDLDRRLMRYPCSVMIYTDAFAQLPSTVRDAVYRRMFEILQWRDIQPKYATLAPADRKAVMEILLDTAPHLPDDLRR